MSSYFKAMEIVKATNDIEFLRDCLIELMDNISEEPIRNMPTMESKLDQD